MGKVDKSKNISIIGFGKLGICMGLVFESRHFNVLGVDLNQDYIESINNKTLKSTEPYVEQWLKNSKNLRATNSIKEAVDFSDTIFIVVATPSLPDGTYDHTQIEAVCNVLKGIKFPSMKHLIITCTTMPGYCAQLAERMLKYGYIVTYNPEFIAQGSIIENMMEPDILLIGSNCAPFANHLIDNIYNTFVSYPRGITYVMPITSAEICKISLNCFITTKIAYTNMIGDIVRESGEDPQVVLDAIGHDTRIGSKCTLYGFGFGGPCFPRDNRALAIYADTLGIDATISKASDKSNNLHHDYLVKKAMQENPDNPVKIPYITYKKGVDMTVESQQLRFAEDLLKAGYNVEIEQKISPEVMKELPEIVANHVRNSQ